MNILELLLSFFQKNDKLKTFMPLFELLQKNSFDIVKTLKNLNLDAVAPLIKVFMENSNNFNNKENPTENSVGSSFFLSPIANVADKDIVYTLNKYFNSTG